VDPRAGPDEVQKREFLTLPGLEIRPLGRPDRSQSLYRLRDPGSLDGVGKRKISCPCQKLEPNHPARSPSLYRLTMSYSGTNIHDVLTDFLNDTGGQCATRLHKLRTWNAKVSQQRRNELTEQQVRLKFEKSLY
jgi:hypothetical protein